MEVFDLGTQTVFFRVRVTLSNKEIGRGAIVSVIIRNPLTNADLSPNALQIWVGDGGNQIYDLLPGANTPEIFAADLKDVYVRVMAAVEEVDETDIIVIAHRYAEPVKDVSRQKRRR